MPFGVVRGLVRTALRLLLHIEVSGLERLPQGNAVIIANHLGWADAAVLLCRRPGHPQQQTRTAADRPAGQRA